MESTERADIRDVRAYQPFPCKRRINSVDSDHESPYTPTSPKNASSSNHAKQFHSMETKLVTYITDLHDKRPCCASKGADERSF